MSYRPTYEDPEYYEDADDSNWQDMDDQEEDLMSDNYSPFDTVNS